MSSLREEMVKIIEDDNPTRPAHTNVVDAILDAVRKRVDEIIGKDELVPNPPKSNDGRPYVEMHVKYKSRNNLRKEQRERRDLIMRNMEGGGK